MLLIIPNTISTANKIIEYKKHFINVYIFNNSNIIKAILSIIQILTVLFLYTFFSKSSKGLFTSSTGAKHTIITLETMYRRQ